MNLVVIMLKMMIQNDNFMVKLYQIRKFTNWSDASEEFKKGANL